MKLTTLADVPHRASVKLRISIETGNLKMKLLGLATSKRQNRKVFFLGIPNAASSSRRLITPS